MRSLWLGVLVFAAMFVACGDDDSDFATRPSDDSSSSVCKIETEDDCEYGELVDDRDGHIYKTVKIGDQWWMAENLNFEMDSSFCYNDSVEYCTKYGRFYSWWTATEVCPNGWHLPSKAEWETLFNAVGGSSVAGTKLKSTSGWYNSGNGTDAFSFSALPAGLRNLSGNYDNEGNYTYFWSSTEHYSYTAYRMYLNCDYDDASLDVSHRNSGFSVRCVKAPE